MALCKMFDEDEVAVLGSGGEFRCGIVLESSEYISSSEDEDENDERTLSSQDKIRKGTVRVAWHPEGTEEIVEEQKLLLSDRSLMPGEVVRRLVEGHDSQRGCVMNKSVRCHLLVLTKPVIICDIDTRDLLSFSKFDLDPGDVYMDSWVGKVERIVEKYTLKFPDGARCEASEDDLSMLEDVLDRRDTASEFAANVYYVGQQLHGELGCLENATWLKSTSQNSLRAARKHRSREVTVTVENVSVESVDVRWLCRGYTTLSDCSNNGLLETPPSVIKGNDLTRLIRLDCFESTSYQLGDNAFYVLKESDHAVALNEHMHCDKPNVLHTFLKRRGLLTMGADHVSRNNAQNLSGAEMSVVSDSTANGTDTQKLSDHITNGDVETHSSESLDEEVYYDADGENVSVVRSSTTVQSVSVEVTNSCSATSAELPAQVRRRSAAVVSTSSTGARGQQKVLTKKKKRKPAKTKPSKPSVVVQLPKPGEKLPVELIYTHTVVDVMWQDGSLERNIASVELFPIHHLDEQEFFPSDFVVSTSDPRFDASSGTYGVVQSVQHTGRTCQVVWMKPSSVNGLQDDVLATEEVSVYDLKEHPDIKYQLGQVVVRVDGSHEICAESSVPAGGQIFAVGVDGKIDVHWADGSHSACAPHQLYVVGDEMTEDDSSDEDDDTDEDNSEDSLSSDWMTEEEEQMMEDTENMASVIESGTEDKLPNGSVNEMQISDPDEFFSSTRSAITKLEELIQICGFFDVGHAVETRITLCRTLLAIYRCCRTHDRMLSTSLFSDNAVSETMREVRSELSKNKAVNKNKQVLEACVTNRLRHADGGSVGCDSVGSPDQSTAAVDGSETTGSPIEKTCAVTTDSSVQSQVIAQTETATNVDSVNINELSAAAAAEKSSTDSESTPALLSDVPAVTVIPVTVIPELTSSDESELTPADGLGTESGVETELTTTEPGEVLASLGIEESAKTEATSDESELTPADGLGKESGVETELTAAESSEVLASPGIEASAKTETNVASDVASTTDSLPISLEVAACGVEKGTCAQDNPECLALNDNSDSKVESVTSLRKELLLLREAISKLLQKMCPAFKANPGLLYGNEHVDENGTQHGPMTNSVICSEDTSTDGASSDAIPDAGEVAGKTADSDLKPPHSLNVACQTTTADVTPNVFVRACQMLRERISKCETVFVSAWSFSSVVKTSEGCDPVESDAIGNEAETTTEVADGKPDTCAASDELCHVASEKPPELAAEQTPITPCTSSDDLSSMVDNGTTSFACVTDASQQVPAGLYIAQGFRLVDAVADSHYYKATTHSPVDAKAFMKVIRKEMQLLQSCLPVGIFVKGFEDRMDLFSVLIQGPEKTPYEDGLFFFDVALPGDYPNSPPLVHYIAYCKDRMNPNLYEDGKVCVSLLGTWTGKGTEVWNSKSNLLQVLVSIQGLILVPEPYYNEAGYEKQKGTQLGLENSRMYNEMAILKLVQSMTKMLTNPVGIFEAETKLHMKVYARRMIRRLQHWLDILPPVQGTSITLLTPLSVSNVPTVPSQPDDVHALPAEASSDRPSSVEESVASGQTDCTTSETVSDCHVAPQNGTQSCLLPEFPLLPVSRGFKMTLQKLCNQFELTLNAAGITEAGSDVSDIEADR